ncbi:hypothetical protein QUF80_13020 [Desulfococcaceae bacterium HSG8]|nr:hypothetical protein [Desulfococcaceae bacterium HSG8]
MKDFPEIGYRYRGEAEGGIRILLYGHYRIAYLIRSENSIAETPGFRKAVSLEIYMFASQGGCGLVTAPT